MDTVLTELQFTPTRAELPVVSGNLSSHIHTTISSAMLSYSQKTQGKPSRCQPLALLPAEYYNLNKVLILLPALALFSVILSDVGCPSALCECFNTID